MRAIRSDTNSNGYRHTYGDSNIHCYSNASTYTDADRVHREMFTHAEAVSDFGWAANSALSFNTAAYCFTERHRSAASDSAAAPDPTANAYGFAAPNSGTATVTSQ